MLSDDLRKEHRKAGEAAIIAAGRAASWRVRVGAGARAAADSGAPVVVWAHRIDGAAAGVAVAGPRGGIIRVDCSTLRKPAKPLPLDTMFR